MASNPMMAENRLAFPGWRVVTASVIGLAFSPGPMIFGSLGLFAPQLEAEFGWARGEIMLTLTVLNIAALLASPLTGRLLDRYGVRPVLFASQAALICGFIALAFGARSLLSLYLLTALWGAGTVGTQSITYTKAISGWFEHRRGLAVGIAAAGLGLGFLIVPLIVSWLLSFLDWKGALLGLAALVVIVSLPINLLLFRANGSVPTGQPLAQPDKAEPIRDILRSRQFLHMAGAIGLAAAVLAGVIPHLPLMARDQGLDVTDAARIAAFYGGSTVLGRILVGWMADRFPVPIVGALFFSFSAVGAALVGLIGGDMQFVGLALLALLIGFGYGAESDIIALLIVRYFGQARFGAIYGYLLAVFLLGASAGPPLLGYGFDLIGSYRAPMLVSAIILAAAVWLLIRLERLPPLASAGADQA